MGLFRFLLALAVVLNHTGGMSGYIIMSGITAVQVFFMISGFLIAFILSTKYDTASRAGAWLFFSNRALRIFIPYWTVWILTFAAVAIVFAVYGWQLHPLAEFMTYGGEMTPFTWAYVVFTNVLIVGQEVALWLSYHAGQLVPVINADALSPAVYHFQAVPQAWSLSLELMFYMLAPLLNRRSNFVLLLIVIGANLLRFIVWQNGFHSSGWTYRFFPFEIGLFVAGMLSYRLYAYLKERGFITWQNSIAVTLAFWALALIYGSLDTDTTYKFIAFAVIAMLLPFLFSFSTHFKTDRWIGEMSYPVYLIHIVVMMLVQAFIQGFGLSFSTNAYSWLIVMITIGLSVAYVYLIDVPLERWRQRRVRSA
ncbi:MAG: acyltransferase [Pseudomonadota bacterium]